MPRHSPYALISLNFHIIYGLGSLCSLLEYRNIIVTWFSTRLRKDFCLSTLCATIVIVAFATIVTTTFGKTNKFYIIASLISVRFLYSVVNDLFVQLLYEVVVGTSGLEPPTSRLSGARSNQLSYAPAL